MALIDNGLSSEIGSSASCMLDDGDDYDSDNDDHYDDNGLSLCLFLFFSDCQKRVASEYTYTYLI